MSSNSPTSPFKSNADLYQFLNNFKSFALSIRDDETASCIDRAFATASYTTATELLGELQIALRPVLIRVSQNDAYPQEMRMLFVEALSVIDGILGRAN